MSHTIITNIKGSRCMQIDDEHLQTLADYSLLSDLLDSNGIVDENVLNKLRLNVVSLLDNTNGDARLLRLCRDVLFHDNMKAFALHQLICLFLEWQETAVSSAAAAE
ncbi:MAG: hypothetical protein HUK02_02250 [Bacteroidaceae bacterium]|nr:hypothetical protein [Bacteroidaceae bacterium]